MVAWLLGWRVLQAQQLAASVDAQQVQLLAMKPPPERQLVSYEDL